MNEPMTKQPPLTGQREAFEAWALSVWPGRTLYWDGRNGIPYLRRDASRADDLDSNLKWEWAAWQAAAARYAAWAAARVAQADTLERMALALEPK